MHEIQLKHTATPTCFCHVVCSTKTVERQLSELALNGYALALDMGMYEAQERRPSSPESHESLDRAVAQAPTKGAANPASKRVARSFAARQKHLQVPSGALPVASSVVMGSPGGCCWLGQSTVPTSHHQGKQPAAGVQEGLHAPNSGHSICMVQLLQQPDLAAKSSLQRSNTMGT
jgi:hypothetical protein